VQRSTQNLDQEQCVLPCSLCDQVDLRAGIGELEIVGHGNPGAWHGTSVTTPAATIASGNNAEVRDGLLGSLEFVFGRPMPWDGSRPRQARTASLGAEDQNVTGVAETKMETRRQWQQPCRSCDEPEGAPDSRRSGGVPNWPAREPEQLWGGHGNWRP